MPHLARLNPTFVAQHPCALTRFTLTLSLILMIFVSGCSDPAPERPERQEITEVEMVPPVAPIVEVPQFVPEDSQTNPLAVLSGLDYTHAYWLNGMRKHTGDESAEILCFETGHYGLALDLANLPKARFGRFDQALGYVDALKAGAERLQALGAAELLIELESKGTVFRAVSSKTGSASSGRPQIYTRQWESGRMAQHYDLLGLNFESADGRQLGAQGTLDVVVWPDSLSFTAKIAPSLRYEDGWTKGVVDKALCVIEKPWVVEHDPRLESETMTVEFWVKFPEELASGGWGYLLGKNQHEGAPGHFSFAYRHDTVSAIMNFGKGAQGIRRIAQRGASFKKDAWNHLALTYDGKTMRYYINAKLQGAEEVNLPRPMGQHAMRLGQRPDGNGGVLAALFDEVRVWDRALSKEEIEAHVAHPEQGARGVGVRYDEGFDRYTRERIEAPLWSDVTLRVRLKTEHDEWVQAEHVEGEWPLWETKTVHLNCNLDDEPAMDPAIQLSVAGADGSAKPVAFDPTYNAYGVFVGKGQSGRDWSAREPEKSGYDDYRLTLDSSAAEASSIPVYFDIYDVAGITGVTAMLCEVDGRPTGIPIQLSKNWHEPRLGAYVRCFTKLPVNPGQREYILRLAYGFYGTLPAASHAQLSLVGWGNHGRWDQLAIGSWGETICFDTDMSCVDVAITDVRMLMARNGAEGKSWNWTDAGWGADWLGVFDAKQQKLATKEMKAAYLAQGPCLTDVHFEGAYGAQREVSVSSQTSTLRTDDHARTFFKLRYDFHAPLAADKAWLFKIGRTHHAVIPHVAYGNQSGLITQEAVPTTLTAGQTLLEREAIEGEAPWWIGFPDGYMTDGRDWGTGTRGLIVRGYRANFGGKAYNRPSVSLPVLRQIAGKGSSVDLLLTAPEEVAEFQPGDFVEMEIEFMTFHREAADYYGPNETYRAHLEANPRSWKTIYRNAIGNDLEVQVSGGQLVSRYPVIVRANAAQVELRIAGGVGKVPLRIEGLKAVDGYALYQKTAQGLKPLDQSVRGNDFWQVDYDQATGEYRMAYNLPLDDGGVSEWVFRRDAGM